MADSRILVDTPATLTAVFYDGETPADPGTVTVTVTRSNGTAIATAAATAGTGAAARTYTLAAQTQVDLITAVWTVGSRKVTTHHEIVGSYIIELAEIRAQRNLADTAKFPTATLEAARWWFEDLAEDFCSVAFTRRFRIERIGPGRLGSNVVRLTRALPLRIAWATAAGVTVDSSDWKLHDAGFISAVGYLGSDELIVGYEHGFQAPSADIRRAALTAVRARLLTDEAQQIPDRTTAMSNEFGTTSFVSQPGQKRATGWPEVDAVLSRNAMLLVG